MEGAQQHTHTHTALVFLNAVQIAWAGRAARVPCIFPPAHPLLYFVSLLSYPCVYTI
jgi:hypothetical protein